MAGFLLCPHRHIKTHKTMRQRIFYSLVLVAVVLLSGCSNRNQTSMMKGVTGKAGELVVVISPDAWDNGPGDQLKEVLMQPQYGLPQDEPILDVINIPKEAFAEIFKTSRNIIITNIGSSVSKPGVTYQRDVYAYTQALVTINAKSQKEFVTIFKQNSDKIVGFLLKSERDRLLLNYSKYHDAGVKKKIEDRFGVRMNIPPGFRVDEDREDFMWIRYNPPEVSQGLLIYSYPYVNDSTFTSNYQIAKRNIFLKNNVPGPTEGSYMTTEGQLPLMFNVFQKDGNYAAELRGLWKVENDFMGGPFVSISMLDLLNNRVVVAEGYVYGPNTDKRNYLRQVEAMIYSAEFINQQDIDKINKQFEE